MTADHNSHTLPEPVDPIAQLRMLGRPAPAAEWTEPQALGLDAGHIPAMIGVLEDESLDEAEGPAVYTPIHAWRALGQLRAAEAVPALLGLLWRIDDEMDDWVAEEVPVVLGWIGPAAIPAVAAYLAEPTHGDWALVAAGRALAEIGQKHADARDACAGALAGQLAHFALQDPYLNGTLISDLSDLRAVEQADVMAAAFAAGRVDLAIMGDWEEVQIKLGLLQQRITPIPPGGWIPELAFMRELGLAFQDVPAEALPPAERRKTAPHRPPTRHKKDVQRKAQRKQEKASRRQQRKKR